MSEVRPPARRGGAHEAAGAHDRARTRLLEAAGRRAPYVLALACAWLCSSASAVADETAPAAAAPPAASGAPPGAAKTQEADRERFVPFAADIVPGAAARAPIDATPLCLPRAIAPARAARLREALGDPPRADAARAWLALHRSDPPVALDALIAARAARDAAEREAAWRALEPLIDDPHDSLRRCARLEAARLLLALRRYPEAAALVRPVIAQERVDRDAGMAARFLRAEALTLAGRHGEALPIHTALQEAGREAYRLAARLRLADRAFASGDVRRAFDAYQALVPEARRFGAPVGMYGQRALRAAITIGDWDSVREWLSALHRTHLPPLEADAVRIAIADLAAARDRIPAARVQYAQIAQARFGTPMGTLAEVRWLSLAPEHELDAAISRLREIAGREPSYLLAHYARVALGGRLHAAGRHREAVDVFGRAAFELPRSALARIVSRGLGEALEALAGSAAGPSGGEDVQRCALLLDAVGWQRSHLLLNADRPGPFVVLGSCYERFGMAASAESVLRAVVRRFAGRATREVALPLARVSLARGEIRRVLAVTRAELAQHGARHDEWQLLRAQALRAAGRQDEARPLLRQLVEAGLPRARRFEAIAALAQLARERGQLAAEAARIAHALQALPQAQRGAEAGHLALEIAHIERRSGREQAALALYDYAREAIGEGRGRLEATWWLAAGTRRRAPRRAALREIAQARSAGPWRALALRELAVEALRERLERGLPNPLAALQGG